MREPARGSIGIAATETHVHVVYERSTSPREVWVASAALGAPDA